MLDAKILLVGCGKMGSAMLQRLAAQASICVVDPAPAPDYLKSSTTVKWLSTVNEIPADFDPGIVVFAVKPQHMAETLPPYAKFRSSVFLSIAAGVTLAKLAALLGSENYAIVRAMPNLPASIGEGITVTVANKNVTPPMAVLCDKVLKEVGTVAWIGNEQNIDAVTALSGSGPAYIFALAEAMTKAGEALGLAPPIANQLARQTISGSGALLMQSPLSAEELRKAVTSPNGTTEAALKYLLGPNGLDDLLMKAMQAAALRARELSS